MMVSEDSAAANEMRTPSMGKALTNDLALNKGLIDAMIIFYFAVIAGSSDFVCLSEDARN
jgi:hypothetical protein